MIQRISDITTLAWPVSRLGEAIELLARKRKLVTKTPPLSDSIPDFDPTNNQGLDAWVEQAAAHLDIEAEAVTTSYMGVDQLLRNAYPAIIQFPYNRRNTNPLSYPAQRRVVGNVFH
ncbi:MAG: hypothetical protein AAF485_06690 [Chloroflexota bacterium]